MKKVTKIVLKEDYTRSTGCEDGFLKVKRLKIANEYEDQSQSQPYSCDIVYRNQVDAVGVVLFFRDDDRQIKVVLRRCIRPALFFRKDYIQYPWEDTSEFSVFEIPAGVLEEGEHSKNEIDNRAVMEVLEETGIKILQNDLFDLGEAILSSPGITVEKVFLKGIEISKKQWLEKKEIPDGDGSLMEEFGELILVNLDEAIKKCYNGELGDSKTEIALYRLQSFLGK